MSFKAVSIRYKGVDLVVGGNFTPYDAGVWRYADGSGQPPSAAELEITEIKYQGGDVFEIYDGLGLLEDLEEKAIEKIEEEGDCC